MHIYLQMWKWMNMQIWRNNYFIFKVYMSTDIFWNKNAVLPETEKLKILRRSEEFLGALKNHFSDKCIHCKMEQWLLIIVLGYF